MLRRLIELQDVAALEPARPDGDCNACSGALRDQRLSGFERESVPVPVDDSSGRVGSKPGTNGRQDWLRRGGERLRPVHPELAQPVLRLVKVSRRGLPQGSVGTVGDEHVHALETRRLGLRDDELCTNGNAPLVAMVRAPEHAQHRNAHFLARDGLGLDAVGPECGRRGVGSEKSP